MYYHQSPTVQNIKTLKASRATAMRIHLDAMKQTSKDYKNILLDLDELRDKELQADNLLARFPDKAGEIEKKMKRNYKLMQNKVDKFLSVK